MLAPIAMKTRFQALKARTTGLTLIEILVGLSVLGIILAVAIPSMADLLEKRRVTAAAEEVAGIITYAKAETVVNNSQLFVRFDPHSSMSCAMVVTSGSSNSCRCYRPADDLCPNTSSRSLRLFQLPKSHVSFKAFATQWAAGANYIRFSREQMELDTQGFEVDVMGLSKGYTLRVKVNTVGRVSICAPKAARNPAAGVPFAQMTGYPIC
jgi:type IV fimbrial biogenesis protein FimT